MNSFEDGKGDRIDGPIPEPLTPLDLEVLETLARRDWDSAALVLASAAASGTRVSFDPSVVKALAWRVTDKGRQRARGRQSDLLDKNPIRGEIIERTLGGTSPAEEFKSWAGHPLSDEELHSKNPPKNAARNRPKKRRSPDEVPHGEKLGGLLDIAQELSLSQSAAEKARANYRRSLDIANEHDRWEEPNHPLPAHEPEDHRPADPSLAELGIALASTADTSQKD